MTKGGYGRSPVYGGGKSYGTSREENVWWRLNTAVDSSVDVWL